MLTLIIRLLLAIFNIFNNFINLAPRGKNKNIKEEDAKTFQTPIDLDSLSNYDNK